ncbi:MAG TPA: precorrin-6y C5,15-methyltransferase (decarboxylating) subunit CbiE [Sporichthyaceae bacterium]|jgi:precorrin-6Y C5,15-methyltransferase (decarboxylating)|nr:precorrin-6y C5,15-methyltransferase (decarboxylating) subunit CbiE [Sporichthyaceae bacterium]
MSERVTVVGIGADGWPGLTETGRAELARADVIVGGPRHLAMLPDDLKATRESLPIPLVEGLPQLLEEYAGHPVHVVASGDPMHYGIGSTLVRMLGPEMVRVVPHPGSVSLACARLGWSVEDVDVISTVGRPLYRVREVLSPGGRVLVLSEGAMTPAAVCALLVGAGFGPSEVIVLEQLGGPDERLIAATAATPASPSGGFDPLNIVAIEVLAEPGRSPLPRTPGLPDDAFAHDGQITKREVRALALARLAPRPGELLWDVGGGSGSIGIEWMRAARGALAISVERRPDRAERITVNAVTLGVPDLRVVVGTAPDALADLPLPDAIFVGGGGSDPAVLDMCWDALRPGGRLVADAVTLQTEAALVDRCDRFGGDLTRLEVSHAVPLGGFTGWRAAHPVTQWAVTR